MKNQQAKNNINPRTYNTPQDVSRSGDTNEKQVMHAIDRHNQSTFPVLNRSERKLVQQHMIKELSQGFEHRRQALEMVLETKVHSIKEACNHVLVTGKTHLRQQRIEYFGEVFRQVEQRMNNLADDFLQDMDDRFERLKSYKNESIRKRESLRLDKSVDDFLDTLDQLMDEFRSIISEHISHSDDKTPAPTSRIPEAANPFNDNPEPPNSPQRKAEMSDEEYQNEFGINDVVDQFMEADLQQKYWK